MNKDRIGEHFRAEIVPRIRATDCGQGFVYFVTDGERVKIGFSENPKSRIAQIQSSCSLPLETLALIRGTMADEQALHLKFHKHRVHGEWFALAPELKRYIAKAARKEETRSEFDAYEDWFNKNRLCFEHPMIEAQALRCLHDVRRLKTRSGRSRAIDFAKASVASLGAMVAAARNGTFDPDRFKLV